VSATEKRRSASSIERGRVCIGRSWFLDRLMGGLCGTKERLILIEKKPTEKLQILAGAIPTRVSKHGRHGDLHWLEEVPSLGGKPGES
jgi:hypothetical protein